MLFSLLPIIISRLVVVLVLVLYYIIYSRNVRTVFIRLSAQPRISAHPVGRES